jgi:hypothetical protein
MTRTIATDASGGPTASADLVDTFEALKASPSCPTLEGKTTLKTILPKHRRWLAARAAAPTHVHPVSLLSKSISCNRESVVGLHCRLLNIALISGASGSQQ